MLYEPVFKGNAKLWTVTQSLNNAAVFYIRLYSLQGFKNSFDDVRRIGCKGLESPVVIDACKIIFLELQNELKIFIRKAKSFFGAALFAKVYNQVIDKGSGVYSLAAAQSL